MTRWCTAGKSAGTEQSMQCLDYMIYAHAGTIYQKTWMIRTIILATTGCMHPAYYMVHGKTTYWQCTACAESHCDLVTSKCSLAMTQY